VVICYRNTFTQNFALKVICNQRTYQWIINKSRNEYYREEKPTARAVTS